MIKCIDFQINQIDVQHRRSLLTLLKIEFGKFEPVYTKISGDKNTYGIFNMFESPNEDELSDNHTSILSDNLVIEIYCDRVELDLICAGSVSDIAFSSIDHTNQDYKFDNNMNSIPYLKLNALCKSVKVPLFHKNQGKFVLNAGHIDITIKLYTINIEKVVRSIPSYDNLYCKLCSPQSLPSR